MSQWDDIARRFHASKSTFSNITKQWITYMSVKLSLLVASPSWKTFKYTLPQKFKQKYRNCRIIIDCTEFYTDPQQSLANKSMLFAIQQNFSFIYNTIIPMIILLNKESQKTTSPGNQSRQKQPVQAKTTSPGKNNQAKTTSPGKNNQSRQPVQAKLSFVPLRLNSDRQAIIDDALLKLLVGKIEAVEDPSSVEMEVVEGPSSVEIEAVVEPSSLEIEAVEDPSQWGVSNRMS
ncbi:LOW QUALITY PROTEIN: hypothetical protein MAR_012762, partial [Mya arenaria]